MKIFKTDRIAVIEIQLDSYTDSLIATIEKRCSIRDVESTDSVLKIVVNVNNDLYDVARDFQAEIWKRDLILENELRKDLKNA